MSDRVRKAQVAAMLGVSPRTVLDMARAGRLPGACQVAGEWLFDEAGIKQYLRQQVAIAQAAAKVLPIKPKKEPKPIELMPAHTILTHANPWPQTGSGIYFLICDSQIVYAGQSINVTSRIAQHAQKKRFDSWAWVPFKKKDLDRAERAYIDFLMPRLNVDSVTAKKRKGRE